jgi:hypothetical protein
MLRTLIGGLVGGLIIFVMGYIFWATPLGEIPYSRATDAQQAAVQTALAQNLSQKDPQTGKIGGTGTYKIPNPTSRDGANLYTNGPIALVDFNTSGFSPDDMGMLLPGFIVSLISGLLMAFGLAAVGGGGRSFAPVARLVICFSFAFTVFTFLGAPIFNHFGWGYWIYAFIAQSISFIVAGLVISRFFLPNYERSTAAEPVDEAPATAM